MVARTHYEAHLILHLLYRGILHSLDANEDRIARSVYLLVSREGNNDEDIPGFSKHITVRLRNPDDSERQPPDLQLFVDWNYALDESFHPTRPEKADHALVLV